MLKQRAKPTNYVCIETDLQLLSTNHKYYADNFLTHPIYSAGNYGIEAEKIRQEWLNKESNGDRTMDTDIKNLWLAYSHVKAQETLSRALLHQSFRKIYAYFPDILMDFEIGYLKDDLFLKYMLEYKAAIEKNMALNLDCWEKQPIEKIEKMIAEIVTKK